MTLVPGGGSGGAPPHVRLCLADGEGEGAAVPVCSPARPGAAPCPAARAALAARDGEDRAAYAAERKRRRKEKAASQCTLDAMKSFGRSRVSAYAFYFQLSAATSYVTSGRFDDAIRKLQSALGLIEQVPGGCGSGCGSGGIAHSTCARVPGMGVCLR